MSFDVLWLPIIISTVLFMPFGAFFYSSKGFGNMWLDAIGRTKEEVQADEDNMLVMMGSTVLISIITVFLIAVLIASIGVATVLDLFLLVFFVYLLVFMIRLKNVLFDGNAKLFKVNMIGILGEFIIVFLAFVFFI